MTERDPQAFETVFRTHYAALCDFVDGYVRSREAARDIVQDLFVNLWERYDSPNPPPLATAYLYKAARNRALQHLRHARVVTRHHMRVTQEPPRSAAAADEEARARDVARAIEEAIDELPERCREVFLLSREQNLTYAQIAETLGISIKTVEAQMWRALKSRRASLAPFLGVVVLPVAEWLRRMVG